MPRVFIYSAAIGTVIDAVWWQSLMIIMAVLSLVLTPLDFKIAHGGTHRQYHHPGPDSVGPAFGLVKAPNRPG